VCWDVVRLGRAAGGVDEDDAVLADKGIVEGAREELAVRPVDGIVALEGNPIDVDKEGLADSAGVLQGKSLTGGSGR